MRETGFYENEIIGTSDVINEKLRLIRKVAESDKSLLILGETGTGKSLTAKKVHDMSLRKGRPFVTINCTDIPEDLFEAELFGYVRGSFTGAVREKPGLLEASRNGTVFLDEIGDISSHLQAKLLNVLDKREFRRIGETLSRKIHARFIFATNVELNEKVISGQFRKDLYFRMSVLKVHIPPLRERREDIHLLVNHFIKRENWKWNAQKNVSPGVIRKLMTYDFPGNVRELENIIERAFVLSDRGEITEEDIKLEFEYPSSNSGRDITPERLRSILEHCRWNKTKAAMKIGRSRRQLYRLLKKHHMEDFIKKSDTIRTL